MVDWKEIRAQWDAVKDAPENESVSDALERISKREDLLKWHFPSLITALEEREGRIEFLEKALDQAIYAADIKIEDNYIVFELDAPAGSEPSTTINWFKPDTLPCLAKYLEEKNG